MKSIVLIAVLTSGFAISSVTARQLAIPESSPASPPGNESISYALGMRLGLQIKHAQVAVDVNTLAQALKDALHGKATRLKDAEVGAVFESARTNGLAAVAAKDPLNVSYAIGMRKGMELKNAGANVDVPLMIEAIQDVLAGKPAKMKESVIAPLFQEAQENAQAEQTRKARQEGAAFLARNASVPGVKSLPDGLEYRVVHAGTGPAPSPNDLIFIKYRGTFINGVEFDHHNHYLTRITGGLRGWQEAMQQMKVGDKWQVFLPPALAFGSAGQPIYHVGPDSTLVYEIEMLAIAQPGDPGIGTGRKGHGLADDQ